MGATISSETTAAATGEVGIVRRDPMAMLPFIGYHAGDYLDHWLDLGNSTDASKLPKIFYVNWFRRGTDGRFLWPGFGENSRVLKWAIGRIDGTASARETPIGYVPTPQALDLSDLDTPMSNIIAALEVTNDEWLAEIPLIQDWFATIGKKLPDCLHDELKALANRLTAAQLVV